MRHTLLALTLLLTACAPDIADFHSSGAMVSNQTRDFAECRIKARQIMGEYGGLAALAAYNETLGDCMTAKGYSR